MKIQTPVIIVAVLGLASVRAEDPKSHQPTVQVSPTPSAAAKKKTPKTVQGPSNQNKNSRTGVWDPSGTKPTNSTKGVWDPSGTKPTNGTKGVWDPSGTKPTNTRQSLTLTQPLKIKTSSREIVVPIGTKLTVVSRNATTARVQYELKGKTETVSIPVTDLDSTTR
jgi:hypothetical protein